MSAVPQSLREGAFGLGANRMQVVAADRLPGGALGHRRRARARRVAGHRRDGAGARRRRPVAEPRHRPARELSDDGGVHRLDRARRHPDRLDRVQDDLRRRLHAVRHHVRPEPRSRSGSSASTGRCTNDRCADRGLRHPGSQRARTRPSTSIFSSLMYRRARARVPRPRRDHLRLRLRRPAGRLVGLRHELPLARDPGERGHRVGDRRDDLPDDHLRRARGPDRGHDRDLSRGVRGAPTAGGTG